jgi:WD40-like Beta Propeller Repeat
VRAELRRIVAGPPFEDAGRLIRFLTFVVEQTLAGNGSFLKESVIGVEVFGRAPGYDSKTDPIVRVQARRLRAKLDAWYQDGGQTSTIRIALPKGGYEPEFAPPPPAEPVIEAPLPPPRRSFLWLAPAAALLLLGASALILMSSKSTPAAPGSRLFTAFPGYQTNPAFSPDGLALAFSWAAVPAAAIRRSTCSP